MILLDTHALIWWVSGLKPLSARARRAVNQALKDGRVRASEVSLLEIATAARRGRLSLGMPIGQWLQDLGALPDLLIEPVSAEIAQLAGSIGDELHGDPVDRIIVATARLLRCRLVTADARLQRSSGVPTVW